MKNANVRHTQWFCFFLTFFTFVLLSSAVEARDATFSWTANSESVDGYRLYYKSGAVGGIPYDGTGATEGNSPVDTGNVTTYTLHNLSDTETYYFVLTAFSGTLESDYTQEVVWTATVIPVDENPPVATSSSISTTEDQAVSGAAAASNDSGLSISYLVQQDVINGNLLLETGTGSFTYTPNADFAGADSFTFLARDDNGDSNIGTVSISITAVNDPPTAENGSITVNEDSSASGQLQAQDPENDVLTYSAIATPAQGTLLVNTTGSFTYTPDANVTGTASFTFQVSDGQASSNSATVSIAITAINDAPVGQDGLLDAVIGETTSGTLLASDTDNDNLTYSLVSDPQQVVIITDAATGSYSITPVAGMSSPYSFTFKVNDGTIDSNTATVTVTLTEAGAITAIFGDTPDSNYPGTLTDTFTNLSDAVNVSSEQISTWSWSSPTPHKPANTIVIKTDLSALQDTVQIIEAKLYLYQTSSYGEAAYTNSVHRIIDKNPVIDEVNGYNASNGEPWSPVAAGTTYSDIPLGLADIDQQESAVTLGTESGYQTWIVTDMVQSWISDSAGNFGLLITGVPTSTETGRTFASSESMDEAFRPKLVISYVPQPLSPLILNIIQIQ